MEDIEVINMKPADLVTSTATGELDGFAWTSRAARLAVKQSEGMTRGPWCRTDSRSTSRATSFS